MLISEFLDAIKRDVSAFVEPLDPIYLGAFFSGCSEVNAAIRRPVRKLLEHVSGPSQADLWSRMALRHPSSMAVSMVLDELSRITEDEPFEAGPSSSSSCIVAVTEAVKAGRPGIILGQTSVLWLRNYVSGYQAALRWWMPERASAEEGRLRAFEAWLAARYGQPGVNWDRLIRVFEGEGQSGVKRFAELWETWIRESRAAL